MGCHGLAREGRLPGEHNEQQHAKGPDIAVLAEGFAAAGLGAEVIERAQQHACFGEGAAAGHVGQAKIGQARRAILRQQHVGGLEIAVDDAQAVGAADGIRQVEGQLDGARRRQRAA